MVTIENAENINGTKPKKLKVHCFVDGFNLYHALDWFNDGKTEEENHKYRKYKWLSLRDLASCFISSGTEETCGSRPFHDGSNLGHWQANAPSFIHTRTRMSWSVRNVRGIPRKRSPL